MGGYAVAAVRGVREAGTVLLEVKSGPYQKISDWDFAARAAEEGELAAASFVAWLRSAMAGDGPLSAQ